MLCCVNKVSTILLQTAILLLRIDDIVSGTKKQMEALNAPPGGAASAPAPQAPGPEDWSKLQSLGHFN